LEALVTDELRARGVTFQHLSVDAASWEATIDHDTILPLDMLLKPATDLAHETTSRHPEGYSTVCTASRGIRTCASPPASTRIRMFFDAGVSAAWRTAFLQAASEWSAAICIEIATTGSATEYIQVQMANIDNPNTYADGRLPGFQNVGHTTYLMVGNRVRINQSYSCGFPCGTIETLSASLKMQVALHELGHTLGFLHPEDGVVNTANWVPGTASATGGANYATVMHAFFGEPGVGTMTIDDIVTRDKLFGGPTCVASPP
jgi:hypothetical protein